MTRFLLDVNVIIALIDTDHSHNRDALKWFSETGMKNWLTCPITENGTLRIVSQPRYRNTEINFSVAADALRNLTSVGNHTFIPDDISPLNEIAFDHESAIASQQITDMYLLALAAQHNAELATFDRRLVTSPVRLPNKRVHLIRS